MKKLLLLLTIFLTMGSVIAQKHYQLRNDDKQGLCIENSTTSGLSLHFAINELSIADIDNGEEQGQEIVMKGSFGSFQEGMPNLPSANQYIAVPKGATVSVTVKEKASMTLNGIELLPAAPVLKNADVGLPKLRKDMSIFGIDTDFPAENAVIVQTTQIRGLDVALLSVTPFRYNPVRKNLEVIYDMESTDKPSPPHCFLISSLYSRVQSQQASRNFSRPYSYLSIPLSFNLLTTFASVAIAA